MQINFSFVLQLKTKENFKLMKKLFEAEHNMLSTKMYTLNVKHQIFDIYEILECFEGLRIWHMYCHEDSFYQ